MLRRVSLAVDTGSGIQKVADELGADITMLDCKDFGNKEMAMLMEIRAPKCNLEDVLMGLRRTKLFTRIYAAQSHNSKCLFVGILNRLPICQAAHDSYVLCVTCAYNSKVRPLQWDILVKDQDALGTLLSRLEQMSIGAKMTSVSSVSREDGLTSRQREVLEKAVSMGYFEFPRRTNLGALASALEVKPSTLSEILRSLERKIVAKYAAELKSTKVLGDSSGTGFP